MACLAPRIPLLLLALSGAGVLAGCELGSASASAEAPRPSPLGADAKNALARATPQSPPLADVRGASVTAVPADQTATGAGSALRFAGTGLEQDLILRQLLEGQPLSFKPVGSTSTVFRMRMAGPVDAAFKSVTSDRPLGPLAEVAAYRLARCLKLDNVPPAVSRSLPLSVIRDALEAEQRDQWAKIKARLVVGDDGLVNGVSIYWIPDLSNVGLENKGDDRLALEWLREGAPVPEGRRKLAGSVSTMMAFDYLVGNFDRWSGGNVRGDSHGERVYIRDHDLAFPARMSDALHRRLWRSAAQVERFSSSFYRNLGALSTSCFKRELASDTDATGHLSERQIRGVFDRRLALISHIHSLIEVRGRDRVLVFE
jgi:hypothetical protein